MTSSIRNFIVIFLVALLLFGAMGHYIVNNAIPALLNTDDSSEAEASENASSDDSSDASGSASESSQGEIPSEHSDYTCVFLGTDVNGVLCSVNLAHVNDGYKTYVFSAIPPSIKVENKSGISPLADIYKRYGAIYTVQKLEAMTGFKIDHYAIVSASKTTAEPSDEPSVTDYDLIKLFNEVGGISCSIKEDIVYTNPDYVMPETSESSAEPGESSADEPSLETSEEITSDPLDDESSVLTSEPEMPNESSEEPLPQEMLITIPAGVYYINADNYTTIMDSAINPYISDVFKNLFTRIFTNAGLAKNTEKQNAYLKRLEYDNFYDEKRALAETMLFKYGASDYKQIEIDYPTKGIGTADWEQAVRLYRNAVKSN